MQKNVPFLNIVAIILQLFKKPHPQKRLNSRNIDILPMGPLVTSSVDKLFFHNLDNLKPTMQPIKGSCQILPYNQIMPQNVIHLRIGC